VFRPCARSIISVWNEILSAYSACWTRASSADTPGDIHLLEGSYHTYGIRKASNLCSSSIRWRTTQYALRAKLFDAALYSTKSRVEGQGGSRLPAIASGLTFGERNLYNA
jgi:hypothetical protein